MQAPSRPANCPGEYKTATGKPTRRRSKAGLKRLPAELIDPELRRRLQSLEALKTLRRQTTANDTYECTNANPAPSSADCDVITAQVLATNFEVVVVTAGSCLTFSYKACPGFFCSLCVTLNTTTDFIGNQLDNAEALCEDNNQAGSILGQDPPQWDAGFTYAGDSLPTYDVC